MPKLLETEILYVPDRRKGEFVFDGIPCATNDTYEIIKQEGVEFICQKIREMVKTRIEMFGNDKREFYGFASNQYFVHLPSKSIIQMIGKQQPSLYWKGDFKYPERLTKNHFIIDTNPSDRFSKSFLKTEIPRGYFIHRSGKIPQGLEDFLTKDNTNTKKD